MSNSLTKQESPSLGRKDIAVGDEIFVLPEALVPCILRPIGQQSNYEQDTLRTISGQTYVFSKWMLCRWHYERRSCN
jgi:hypothetical protein